MVDDKTRIVNVKDIKKASDKEDLKSIISDLDERGYKAIKQIVAYLVSADPGYITNYKDCRKRIQKLDREELLEEMLESYIK